MEYSARALCYKEASEFRSSSLEVNVARAREAIEFYIEAGDAESGYQILSNLFPGEYYTRNEKDERVLREEPKDEKLKKEELYALIEANKYQPFKANRTFPWEHFPYPRPEGDDSCDYLEWRAMRHDDYDFIFLLGEMRKTPEIECEPEQMLSIYESIGWFDHASEFAATHGFMERVGTYDFLSDELKVTNPKSKDYHGNLK